MTTREEILSRIAQDYADFWLEEDEGIARIVKEAEKYGEPNSQLEYNELYYFTTAEKILGSGHFFEDTVLKLLAVDEFKREIRSEGNQYGRQYYGWRFLTILSDRPHSLKYYLHAVREQDYQRKNVVEKILHTSSQNVRELIKLGLLETRRSKAVGNITGRSLLNVYREVVTRITPEMMGISKFPTVDLPTSKIIDMVKEQFMPKYIDAINHFSKEQNIQLDKWYDLDYVVSQLQTSSEIFHKWIKTFGFEIKKLDKSNYVLGIGIAAFFNMPVLKYAYEYGIVFDTRGNIKPQVCRHFSMSSSQFNTFSERGIINNTNPSTLVFSLRNLYGNIITKMSYEELGIYPYMGELRKAPNKSIQKLFSASMTTEEFMAKSYLAFRNGLLKNLPKLADYYDIDLSRNYTAKEIVDNFGIKRSPVSRAEEIGILKAIDPSIIYNKEYAAWSVALLVAMHRPRGIYYVPSDKDNTFCDFNVTKKLGMDRESGFPFLKKEEIDLAFESGVFTRFYVQKVPQLKPGEIYGFWNELIRILKVDDIQLGKLQNGKLKKMKKKSSGSKPISSIVKNFCENVIRDIPHISKNSGVAYDKDYSLDEVMKISGLSRSRVAIYCNIGLLHKRGHENQYEKYNGYSVAMLAGMHDFSKAMTFEEAARALYLDKKDIEKLIKENHINVKYDDREKVTGNSVYKVYLSLVSELENEYIEKKLEIDIPKKYEEARKKAYSMLQSRFKQNLELFVANYEKQNDIKKIISLDEAAAELDASVDSLRLFLANEIIITENKPSRIYRVSLEFYKSRPNFRKGVTPQKAKELLHVNDAELDGMVECDLIRSQKDGLFRVDSKLANLYDHLTLDANKKLSNYIRTGQF